MNKKRTTLIAASVLGFMSVSSFWIYHNISKNSENRNLVDEALLALIKNDQKAFEEVITSGADVHSELPKIDGKTYTIAEGIAYFERENFGQFLNQNKVSYVKQNSKAEFDILTLAVKKNNPKLFSVLAKEDIKYQMDYGPKAWTLLHMASAWCSDKLLTHLEGEGKVSWNQQAKDGSTPLTLAAEHDCLPMLSYWKEQGADFKKKDGRGLTALSILKKKKDAALMAFAESFEERKIATITVTKVKPKPDFYKKRKIPRDQIVDHAAMLEPEDRPLEATETAEFSEFAD